MRRPYFSDRLRATLRSPSLRAALQAAIQIVLCAALCFVLQALAMRHNVRFDLTPAQSFVLSEQAKQIAAGVGAPVRLTVFYSSQQNEPRRQTVDLLEQFHAAAPGFTFRLFDLDRSPGLAQRYGITAYHTGALEVGDRTLVIKSLDEDSITNGLLKLSPSRTRTVCFVTGHGERSPENRHEREGYSDFARALDRENFAVRTLDAIPAGAASADCSVVIIAGPTREIPAAEAATLARHLRDGSRALLLADPNAPGSVAAFLREFGIEAGNDTIVDEQSRFIGWDSFVAHVVQFNQSLYGAGLTTEAVFGVARTVRPAPDTVSGIEVIPIAATGGDSWALVGASTAPEPNTQFRVGIDHRGPLSVGVQATLADAQAAETGRRGGRLIVFGDSDFASNFYFNLLGNKDLILSTVAILAEEPALVGPRRRGSPRGSISPITLSAGQGRAIFWATVVAPSAASLAVGGAVAVRRRRRRGGR